PDDSDFFIIMACVQPDDSDLSESDLDYIEDEYRLDISESDSSETDSESGAKLTHKLRIN
ncbi:hypothetical protein AVEN_150714-1, partial [Araneus ventricosus]